MENTPNYQYIGKGIYSLKDAERLAGIKKRTIHRWLRGYHFKYKDKLQYSNSLFRGDYKKIDNKISLSFLDLIEIRFIEAFRKHGVSWRTIRRAAIKAQEELKISHPFTTRKFYTDGRSILIKVYEEGKDPDLFNLLNEQLELEKLIKQYLYEGLDFSDDEFVKRWWPLGKKNHIVIDPERCFGQPIIHDYAIPTESIFQGIINGETIKSISEWFNIPRRFVNLAIKYEKQLN